MDVLLTDASSRLAYSALRSLHSLRLDVAVADTSMTGMCQWSRFAKARYTYRSPFTRPEQFVEDICGILKITGAKFLLPGYSDTEVLAKYRDRLPGDIILPVADYDSIRLANDKYLTNEFAMGVGVPVPEMLEWRSIPELERELCRKRWEVVVKTRRGHSSKGVFYPRDVRETLKICQDIIDIYELPPERYPIVQRKVDGAKWGVASVYFKGAELSSVTQHMLREKPLSGGTGTYRITAKNETLEDYTRRILNGLHWHGIVMAEYKYNHKTGEYWLIELNPRLWGSISHAVAADADFVKLLYIACTKGAEEAHEVNKPCRMGVYGRWIMGDMMIMGSELKKFKFRKALRVFAGGRSDDFDDLKMDDLRAFGGQCAYFAKKYLFDKTKNTVDKTLV